MKTDGGVSANQRSRARAMRGAPTEAERRLWRLLQDRRLSALKFRRQAPVGPYIVDFLCVASKLIVEADGSQHGDNRHDEVRDAHLAAQGWKVLRFWNSDILRNRETVLDTIVARAVLPGEADPHPAAPGLDPGVAGHLLPEGERDASPENTCPEPDIGDPHA